MRATLPTLSLALVLAAPVAAFAQNKVEQQMFADLRMLQEQSQQQRLALNALAETLKTIIAKQEEQAGKTSKAFADQKLLTDAITDRLRILAEKGDDATVRISTVAHELEAMRATVQALQTSVVQAVASMNTSSAPGALATDMGSTNPQTSPTPINEAAAQSPKVMYDQAFGDYASSRYDLAAQGFQAYLRTFPNSPNAYQAQFYIGESYFYLGRYRDATQAYREVIETYKKSLWEPDAYYKRGMCYLQLSMKDQARADLQYVIKNFPDNNLAPLAKAALDGIK